MLFAQTVDPVLGGVAGWAGAGLLGLVLAWVFFRHLPDKDKQIREILTDQTNERKEDRAARCKDTETLVATWTREAKYEREDCNRRNEELFKRHEEMIRRLDIQHAEQMAKIAETHAEQMVKLAESHVVVREVRHEVANMAQAEANRRAVEEARNEQRGPRVHGSGSRGPKDPTTSGVTTP